MFSRNLLILLPLLIVVSCTSKDEIAKINNESITQSEFEAHLEYKRINLEDSKRVELELALLIEQTALATAIEKLDDQSLDVVNAEVEAFRKQILISRYLNDFLEQTVSDAAIENYYNANLEEFTSKQAHIAHIIVRTHDSMTESEKQAAAQRARTAYSRLLKGEAFELLVKEFSEDLYSSEKGGDLGWVDENTIDINFSAKAFELSVNQFSEIVQTQYGYHILKALSPVRNHVQPLSSVRGDIRYQLRLKAKQAETDRLLSLVDIVDNGQ